MSRRIAAVCMGVVLLMHTASCRPSSPPPPPPRIVANATRVANATHVATRVANATHVATVANATRKGTDDVATAAGCGFLWLFKCDTIKVTIYCRCMRGCTWDLTYVLGFDANNLRYCTNGAYNYGSTCKARYVGKFNDKTWFIHKNGNKFYVNGYKYTPNSYSSTWDIRTTC